jgi:hypothetical protein
MVLEFNKKECFGKLDFIKMHDGVKKYPTRVRITFFLLLTSCTIACTSGIREGSSLTATEIEYIRSLGLLDSAETIILFHSQAGGRKPISKAGNFITNDRVAAYWIDEHDSSKTTIYSASYTSIDTLIPNYPASWPAGTSIKVDLKGANFFNVWVNGDSAAFWAFYHRALAEWKNSRKDDINGK